MAAAVAASAAALVSDGVYVAVAGCGAGLGEGGDTAIAETSGRLRALAAARLRISQGLGKV